MHHSKFSHFTIRTVSLTSESAWRILPSTFGISDLLQANGCKEAWVGLYQNETVAQNYTDSWYFEYGNGTKVPFSGFDPLWHLPTEPNAGSFGTIMMTMGHYFADVARVAGRRLPVICQYEPETGE